MLGFEIGPEERATLAGPADLRAELRRVELLLAAVEAMVGTEIGLVPRVVGIESGVDLGGDHRLARPAAEELIASLAVEDGGEPGLAGRSSEQVLGAGHGVAKGKI